MAAIVTNEVTIAIAIGVVVCSFLVLLIFVERNWTLEAKIQRIKQQNKAEMRSVEVLRQRLRLEAEKRGLEAEKRRLKELRAENEVLMLRLKASEAQREANKRAWILQLEEMTTHQGTQPVHVTTDL